VGDVDGLSLGLADGLVLTLGVSDGALLMVGRELTVGGFDGLLDGD
jgi:hypothetical protein